MSERNQQLTKEDFHRILTWEPKTCDRAFQARYENLRCMMNLVDFIKQGNMSEAVMSTCRMCMCDVLLAIAYAKWKNDVGTLEDMRKSLKHLGIKVTHSPYHSEWQFDKWLLNIREINERNTFLNAMLKQATVKRWKYPYGVNHEEK